MWRPIYTIASFLAGLVFGLGLLVSGMANPAKVRGFLDVTGVWDPSLALVMVGAVAVGALAFALAGRRARSLLGAPMLLPTARSIEPRLVVGSLVFGLGWGLAGICPGPALVLVGYGSLKGCVFLAAMLTGNAVFEFFEKRRRRVQAVPVNA
jgi:uncharacterized membrane protein YedE/YeeE